MHVIELWTACDPDIPAEIIRDENGGDSCDYRHMKDRQTLVEALRENGEDRFNISSDDEDAIQKLADKIEEKMKAGKRFYLFNCHC